TIVLWLLPPPRPVIPLRSRASRFIKPILPQSRPLLLRRRGQIPSTAWLADPFLRVGREPHGREPLVEPELGVLEDRPNLHAVLLLAGFALPQAARRLVSVFSGAAARTERAVRPAKGSHELRANIEIGEVTDRLWKRLRLLLPTHSGEYNTSRPICQG